MSSFHDVYWLNSPSVIIDDQDLAIQYDGSWHSANETEIQTTPFAQQTPYFNTLHVLQVFSGSFSYGFIGAGVAVFATPFDNSNYTSQCFLDGNLLPFDHNATKAQFGQSQPVCQAFGLPDNILHTISVNVSVPPRQHQDADSPLSGFAFDYMLIQPPSGVLPWYNGNQDVLLPILNMQFIQTVNGSASNSAIFLGDTVDGIADLSSGWKFDPENGFSTTTPGTQLNLTFIGTSLWWYGYFTPLEEILETSHWATVSLDGGTPMNLSDVLSSSQSQGLVFRTSAPQYASHHLTFVYHGGESEPSLTLQSLIIQKSLSISISTVRLLPSATVFRSPNTMSQLPTPPIARQRRKPGAFIGGIAGGVILLLIVASGICLLIRRAKRTQRFMQTLQNGATVAPEPFPAPTEETVGVIAPRKAQPDQQNIDNPFMQQELQAPPLTKWTRRHTILDSSGRMPSLSGAGIQPHGPSGSRLSLPLTQDAFHFSSTDIDAIVELPGNASHPAPTNAIVPASSLITTRRRRQEDSGLRIASMSDLPPLYTTH